MSSRQARPLSTIWYEERLECVPKGPIQRMDIPVYYFPRDQTTQAVCSPDMTVIVIVVMVVKRYHVCVRMRIGSLVA
jgi:hypothetical protein